MSLSIGLLPTAKRWFRLLPAMLNLTGAITMTGLGSSSALRILIGLKQSTWRISINLFIQADSISRVKEMLRSRNYSVSGDQWPVLLYKDELYDAENPWRGLFKNRLLILVSMISSRQPHSFSSVSLKAFKHIFTSPSSVEKEPKATRSGNARIHGMIAVTIPSIAYVATQVCYFDIGTQTT